MTNSDQTYYAQLADIATTLNSRVGQVISSQASNTTSTVVDVTNIEVETDVRKLFISQQQSDKINRRRTFIETVSNTYSADIITIVEPSISATNDKATVRITTTVFVKLDSTYSEVLNDASFAIYTANVVGFNAIKQYVSGIFAGPVNNSFKDYLATGNSFLKSSNKLPSDKMLVAIIDDVNIPSNVLSPSSAVDTTITPIPPTPTQTKPAAPDTPVQDTTTPSSSSADVPASKPNTSKNEKYLSIEAVSEDITQLLVRSASNDKLSVNLSSEDISDLLTRESRTFDTTQRQDLANVENQDAVKPESPPQSTTHNSTVARNQKTHLLESTESQRQAESSNALLKSKSKLKSAVAPLGASVAILKTGGKKKTIKNVSKKTTNSEKPKQLPIAKTFIEWAAGDGKDPSGIVYRGHRTVPYLTPDNVLVGQVDNRFKSLFNFGKDLTSMFGSNSIDSPIDVVLLLNPPQVGQFNEAIPYIFAEGSEVHSAIILASTPGTIINRNTGGIGTYTSGSVFKEANWGEAPFWCGYLIDFLLSKNGEYKVAAPSILGTASVESNKSAIRLDFGTDYTTSGITQSGKDKLDIISKWKGAYIVRRPLQPSKRTVDSINAQIDELQADITHTNTSEVNKLKAKLKVSGGGHVELALHISPSTGILYTIGGNTGIDVGMTDRNGQTLGFKKYTSLCGFSPPKSPGASLYFVEAGSYTNSLGTTLKKTKTFTKYSSDIETNKKLNSKAYNILREIME